MQISDVFLKESILS